MSDDRAILRYVVLRHEGVPEPHFDLMIEPNPADLLWTFRCARWPLEVGQMLRQLPDHRREYLDYEGLVSGGRGVVRRIERGESNHAFVPSYPPQRVLHLGRWGGVRIRQVIEGARPTDQWEVVELSR